MKTVLVSGGLIVVLGLVLWRVLLLPSVSRAILLSPAARPVVMQTLGNYTDTEEHAKYFLLLIRQRQYAPARSLMTPGARKSLTTPALQGQWAAFESTHGRVTKWTDAGSTDNLLPEYVDRRYQVSGSRGSAGLVTLRLTRPAGSPPTGSPYAPSSWQVDVVTFSR